MRTYQNPKKIYLRRLCRKQVKEIGMKKLLALVLVVSSTVVFAQRGRHHGGQGIQERLVIQVNQHLRGQNVIKLKQQIRAQYGQMDFQNMQLDRVRLVAKSKKGRGEAVLVVGQNASYPATITGSPYDFQTQRPYTFARVGLVNPSRSSQGKWQIELKGNIKVKKVVVLVTKKRMNRMKTVVIPMYGQHTRGQSVLKIKQLIKQQRPNIDLSQMKLKKVTLVAKSKQGRGQATLVTGQSAGYPATVYGSPRGFHSNAPRTYSEVSLRNTSGSSQGRWQVELRGNIKVDEIVVTMKKMGRGQAPSWPVPTPRRRGGRRN